MAALIPGPFHPARLRRRVLAGFRPHPYPWWLPGREGISQSSAHSCLPWWLRVGRGHFREKGEAPSILGSGHPVPAPHAFKSSPQPLCVGWGTGPERGHHAGMRGRGVTEGLVLAPGGTMGRKLLTRALGVIPQPHPSPSPRPRLTEPRASKAAAGGCEGHVGVPVLPVPPPGVW